MIIVITGPQGSGKGTQADKLSEELGLLHVESGDILRDLAKTNSKIRKMLANGELVDGQETIEYMEEYIKEKGHGFDDLLFDGFPRTIDQYELMAKWLKEKGHKIDEFIYLDISDEEAVKRLSARKICVDCEEVYNTLTKPPKGSNCDLCGGKLIQREDDKPEAIKKRLSIFHRRTQPMLKEIGEYGSLLKVDGERSVEVIFEDIVDRLKKINAK